MNFPATLFSTLLFSSIPASAVDYRMVMFLLDTNFALMRKFEFRLSSTGQAQKPEIVLVAAAMSPSPSQILVATETSGQVWMGGLPGNDYREVYFISDSRPALPLLSLWADAMCGGCAHIKTIYGDVRDNPPAHPKGALILISAVPQNVFLGDQALNSNEIGKIRDNIQDSTFIGPTDKSIDVQVVKLPHYVHGGPDQVKYVVFFREAAPSASIRPLFRLGLADRVIARNVLGRLLVVETRVRIYKWRRP